MSQSQTLLFPSATHLCVLFKAGFVMSRLHLLQSLETELTLSFSSSGSFCSLSFFFVKSGLPHREAQRVPHIHLTCHFGHSSLDHCLPFPSRHCSLCFTSPLPPPAVVALPRLLPHSSEWSLPGLPWQQSKSVWVLYGWKEADVESCSQLLLAVTARDSWIQLCGFLWNFPTMIPSVLP